MGTGIKGFKSQKILKTKLKGYTEDQSIDYERYATIQELTGDKHGIDTVNHGAYQVNLTTLTVASGSNIRTIICTSHGAVKGDQVRFIVSGVEASVLGVPDANTIILGSELSFDPTGLTFNVLRHVTQKLASDGSVQVNQGPAQFKLNNVATEVSEDTSTPANNHPLPSAMMIRKDDGNYYPVMLDTTDPFNHTPIPVTITDVTGTSNVNVNLAGSTLNVSIKHNSTDPSSVRVGNGGTGASQHLLDVNANSEALTHDADVLTILGDGNQKTQIVGATGNVADVSTLASTFNGGTKAVATVAVMHAKNGANYVDVLANSSGNLLLTSDSVIKAQLQDNAGSAITLGQQLDTASVPVVLPATQITALTPPTSVTVTQNTGTNLHTVVDSGSITVTQATGTNLHAVIDSGSLTVTQATGTNLHAVIDSGSITVTQATGTNLHTVVDSGSVNATLQTTSGTITQANITVGTSVARATVSGAAPSASRKKLIISPNRNNTGAIYLGSSAVTIATGLEIIGPDRMEFLLDASDYYLISDTVGQSVRVIEVV